MAQETRHVVGGAIDVLVGEDHQHAHGGPGREGESDLAHHGERRLRPHDGAREVRTTFAQELVEVVARDATIEVGVSRREQRRVLATQALDLAHDPAAVGVGARGRRDLLVAREAQVEDLAPVGHHAQSLDVVDGLAVVQRVGAAGIVADHAAEGAPGVRGGVGTKGESDRARGGVEVVEHHTGLDPRAPLRGVDLEDRVHVPTGVEHDRDVAGLTGQTGPRTATQDRGVVAARDLEGRDDVGLVARVHHAEWHLAVVGGVGRVERSRRGVEEHFAAHGGREFGGEREALVLVDPRAVDVGARCWVVHVRSGPHARRGRPGPRPPRPVG